MADPNFPEFGMPNVPGMMDLPDSLLDTDALLHGQAPPSFLAPHELGGMPAGQPPPILAPPASNAGGDVFVPSPVHIASLPAAPLSRAPSESEPEGRAAAAPPPAKAKKASRGGRGGVITMRVLIEEGILEPGNDVLSVEYKGMSHTANLAPDGRIVLHLKGKEIVFESPSAFSIYLKRLVNPSRKADDGWKTVKYKGRLLEQFKGEYLKKKLGDEFGGEFLEPSAKRTRYGPAEGRGSGMFTVDGFQGLGPVEDEEEEKHERPRRVRKAPPRFAALGVDDEHSLQPLEAYTPSDQPFQLKVSSIAEAVMDFHAHLSTNEVIGVLAGNWDPEKKVITIMRAFAVKELATEDDSINVEMDPESEIAVREEITKLGMKVVGWYHSHPFFPTQPSRIDVYNQVLQQHHHREDPSGLEPYVAAIVGPYDKRNTSPVASTTWFYVDHTSGSVPSVGQRPEEVGCVAKELIVERIHDEKSFENLTPLQRDLEALAKRYAPTPDRAHLEGKWKEGISRIEKLVNSVQSRLPVEIIGEAKLKNFGSKVYVSTRAVWNVYAAKDTPAAPVLPAVPSAGTLGGNQSAADSGAAGNTGGHHDGDDEPISDEDDV